MRGPLAPPGVPISRTPAEQFDDLVLDAVEQLELRWAKELAGVEFAVEPVPPRDELTEAAARASADFAEFDALTDFDELDSALDRVPLARTHPAAGNTPARIVLYRRPLEARAGDRADLADLVLDVLVHEVAELLDRDVAEIDPEGHGEDDDEA